MSFRKLVLILTITVSILFVSLLSVSYAWYSLTDASTEFEVTTANEDLTVMFAQSSYVSLGSAIPIAAEDAATDAGISRFSVTPGDNLTGYDVAMSIGITNIQMDDELKISDFRIQLYENDVLIFNGTGEDVTDTTITLKQMTSVTIGTTYSYELRIWIEETNTSQNNLMGKSFSGNIRVSSSMKK